MNRISKGSKAGIALAFAAATVLPMGLATSAQASTTTDGCTVTPSAPYFAGTYTTGNVPEVYYPYDIDCGAQGVKFEVEVKTRTWEADRANTPGDVDPDGINNADEDYIGQNIHTTKFGKNGGTKSVLIKGVLPHTDTDSNEEVYGAVKFQVNVGLSNGGWTDYELTQPTQIWW